MPITTLVYRESRFVAHNPPPESLATLRTEPGVMLWVDLSAPTEEEIKLVLETTFQFHPLAIEDCVADSPFPKLEDFDTYLYLVMHAVDYTKTAHFTTTELDLFLGKTFIVTFHRQPLKPVQAALERYLKSPGTPVRGPDRFAHGILDLMVEAYKPALDELQHELDALEADLLRTLPADQLFPRILALRKELSSLRQIVRPQREIVAELAQGKTKLIRSLMVPYLRDLVDDLLRIETQAGAWADQVILSFRVYLNKTSHEANEGIRLLTAITALTIPVLLVGAWYGMNYEHMPELPSVFGYPLAAFLTLGGTIAMLWVMKKKKWL
ncbi:MAG: magnesium transporter CorA family protein [Opitutae bacterium]|nr:magnesium transporter CorA family protein [Opitutae bacterium]